MTQTIVLLFSDMHIILPFKAYNFCMLIFQVTIDLKDSEVGKINLVQSVVLVE